MPRSISASPSKRIDCDVSSADGGSIATVQEKVVGTPGRTGCGSAPKEVMATFEQSPPPGRVTGRVTASPEPLSMRLTKASSAPLATETSIRAFSGIVVAARPRKPAAAAAGDENQSATPSWPHSPGPRENALRACSRPVASRRTSSPAAPSGPPTIVRFVRVPGTFSVWSTPLKKPTEPAPRSPSGQAVTNCWAEKVPFLTPAGSTLFVRAATRSEAPAVTRRAQAVPSGNSRRARTRDASTTPFAGTETTTLASRDAPTARTVASTAAEPGLKSLRSVLQKEPR